ncbi:MAG: N-acetylmuramoyl-L-alanine amidase [Chlamydiia bacterium]|nr:N-acetylmuramoyl-L-alanine amidase [Chlamydiia bacterium]
MVSRTKIIVLSKAHYPEKAGASYKGVTEHKLSIKWIGDLHRMLMLLGYDVRIAPVGGLTSKVEFINNLNADLALEIHFNGSSNPNVSGVETLYCPNSKKGKVLAQIVHEKYAPTMRCKDRGIKEGWYKMDRPGVEDYPGDIDGDEIADYFLRKTNCPAIILEPDFISQYDNINLKQELACSEIVKGINKYINMN